MPILVFVESAEGKIKKTSLEAVAYAHANGWPVTAIALGDVDKNELEALGKFGAQKVLHASDQKLNEGSFRCMLSCLRKALSDEGADTLVLANSSLELRSQRMLQARIGASLATNVVELPSTSGGFVVKRSIYTGKAFSLVTLSNAKKVITIRKNAAELKEVGGNVQVTAYALQFADADFTTKIFRRKNRQGNTVARS
jgi:electron transfer flavoprotein alpha subunit